VSSLPSSLLCAAAWPMLEEGLKAMSDSEPRIIATVDDIQVMHCMCGDHHCELCGQRMATTCDVPEVCPHCGNPRRKALNAEETK
jgi:hypothetical protein